MKKPKNFNEVIDTHKESTQIVVRGMGMYIRPNDPLHTGEQSVIWITDDSFFNKTAFTNEVLRILIKWDEFRMIVTRCRKGDGVKGDVVQTYPFIRNDVESWNAFRLFLSNRVNELYNTGQFGNH